MKPTVRTLFCDGWSFCEAPVGVGYENIMREGNFAPVEIPHDYMIYDTRALYRTSEGWYRREYFHTPEAGRRTILRFEGVYMDTTVFVNGAPAFEWKYGYTTFEADITDFLVPGKNLLAVRCVYRDPNTRWYSGAGIYRRIFLISAPETRIISDGVYASAKRLDGGAWLLTVATETTASECAGKCNCTVVHTLTGEDGENVTFSAKIGEDGRSDASVEVQDPLLWDPDGTHMYTLKTELFTDGAGAEPNDVSVCRIGFREISLDPERGFFINGRSLKLHGVCEHHDLGALGAAFNAAAMRRKLSILSSMGVNALRTSHNPPAPELLDLCDEMGILVIDEAFDMWEHHKTEHDYASFFPEWHERDVRSWIMRDRNHPSVVMWSIGNEIGDTTSPRGVEVTRELSRLVRLYDPRGNAFVTSGSNFMRTECGQQCGLLLDAVGYNYTECLYDEHHKKYPSYVIYGSETASTVQSRGIYHFPYSSKILTHDDHQCSSLFNCTTSWGSKSTEYNITEDRRAEFCAGQFIWTGFDYIGEPTPYDTKNSYFGQIDTAGFPKDSYFAYRAEWTDAKKSPFVHITPSVWDYNEGEEVDVTVHTNAAKSELFFNGKSLGSFVHDHSRGMEISKFWHMPYKAGILSAVAYDEDGSVVARDEVRTSGDTAELRLEADRTRLSGDGRDMAFVSISAYDKDGNFVGNARRRVSVTVTGAGRLVGLDNGDSTDYEQYKTSSRRLFSGRLLAIVASDGTAGEIKVTVSSPGLPKAELLLTADACGIPAGLEIRDRCAVADAPYEVPLRKIELSASAKALGRDAPEAFVSAKLCPADTTYGEDDIEWRVFSRGIESDLAKVEARPGGAVVRALSDGEFTVRASAKLGTPYPAVISEVAFSASGIGSPTHDAASYTAGILGEPAGYEDAPEPLLLPERDGSVRLTRAGSLVFSGMKFSAPSRVVRLRAIRHGDECVPLRIFDVTCGGRELLGSFDFHIDAPWSQFAEGEFTLSRPLSGTAAIELSFGGPLILGGFSFPAEARAFGELFAAECDVLYGDAFVREADAVTHIGNNVTVGFTALDFGGGADTVTVRGQTRHEADTVALYIGGEVTSVPFTRTEAPTEVTVPVKGAVGVCDVNAVFLPGCDFDLYSIRFGRGTGAKK